jgi:uncharacterized protein
MNLFLDTSALVKLFHEEQGSDRIIEMVTQDTNDIWVLDLVRIEFLSALFRRLRSGEINHALVKKASDGFFSQLNDFHVEPLNQAVLREAEDLIRAHGASNGLRTLDALHLAAFSLIAERDWRFVTVDSNQAQVANAIGWTVWNPLETCEKRYC